MAKLVFLLAIACFQITQQEETVKSSDEVSSAVKDTLNDESIADEGNWSTEKDTTFDEKWTEEDEKWFQEIQDLLEGSDEDYDDNFEEIFELILEIEKWIQKSHPEKKTFKWLLDIKNLLDDYYDDDWDSDFSRHPDYIKKEKNVRIAVDDKDNLDLYYSWLYRMKLKNNQDEKVEPIKRFSSV